jgi:hypothetical protein
LHRLVQVFTGTGRCVPLPVPGEQAPVALRAVGRRGTTSPVKAPISMICAYGSQLPGSFQGQRTGNNLRFFTFALEVVDSFVGLWDREWRIWVLCIRGDRGDVRVTALAEAEI